MSRFFSQKYAALTPYTPGEQPQEQPYIKLNTNESPFPPSPMAQRLARQAAGDLQLYSDPECKTLCEVTAQKLGVSPEQLLFTNGSDEILNFAFMAFCDQDHPAVFPEVTYGFYPVFARLNGVPFETIPLKSDFSVAVEDYLSLGKTIFIANPNAPTGLALSRAEIERIVSSNPNSVVVIDEAYVDFGTESAVELVGRYDNLLVCQTFSKSRSLAGGRLGFGVASRELIADLHTIKYSTNPYNVNRMTMAAGVGAMCDEEYFAGNCRKIMKTRARVSDQLGKMGFWVTDSKANFLFARHEKICGRDLYLKLKENGVLVRNFDTDLLRDYIRITIGSDEDMDKFLSILQRILEETV